MHAAQSFQNHIANKAVSRLTKPQKAAIVLQFMLTAGVDFSLQDMPERLQGSLARDLLRMRPVDRSTLLSVLEEFVSEVEDLGLPSPLSMEKTIDALEGKISDSAITRLKRNRGIRWIGDPWTRIGQFSPDILASALKAETVEVGAVILSKLPTPTAAAVMGRLPGILARRLAINVSQTSRIRHDAIDRIGQAFLSAFNSIPESPFEEEASNRIGAILQSSKATTRINVLEGLEETDAALARQVRKAIFIFSDIPARLMPGEISTILKKIDRAMLIDALVAGRSAGEERAVDFILNNVSQRMKSQFLQEMEDAEIPRNDEIEANMMALTEGIMELEQNGEIRLAKFMGP